MEKCPIRKALPDNATIADGLRSLQTINQRYDECALKHNTLVDAVIAKEQITNQP